MQRPRSEGGRPASHSQSRPPMVSRSFQFSSSDYRGKTRSDLNNPRRPNTTPKPRIQRLLLGQHSAQDWHTSRQLTIPTPSTLAHLPKSPPRLSSLNFIEHFPPVRDANTVAGDVKAVVQSTSRPGTLRAMPAAGSPATSVFRCQSALSSSNGSSPSLQLINNGSSCSNNDEEIPSIHESRTISLESERCGEGDNTSQQPEVNGSAGNNCGPMLADIRVENIANDDNDDDVEYKQLVADRVRLLDDEANRQRIREELETYVDSLNSRTDEDGEHLVEFPQNYNKIVSLMTQKDVQEESESSQDGKTTRQSWSRVLIESGLSKQQAFGVLEDGDDDPDDKDSLAAKIALKMAHIRQLDTILEEKLGKNLYSNILPKKQKRVKSPPQPTVAQGTSIMTSNSSRIFVTKTQSNTPVAIATRGNDTRSATSIGQSNPNEVTQDWTKPKKISNFIERNKEVVANGMKANMTKDEEARLANLLSDEVTPTESEDPADGESNNAEPRAVLHECNEFTMASSDKAAIEELIASKGGAYPLFGIDELQVGPADEVLPPARESNRAVKSNIIQLTKRERLQRQHLSRVEQELRFLQESPSVVIVGDDHDGDGNDDCRSEISYATVASSTCSTRSGVISRHDFKCFLAEQVESYRFVPTASAEEIRRLLLSTGRETSPSTNVVTATTG